jgi:hypothetical protein
MDPSHHHHHHHHRLHLHLDPRHHHHVHIRFCPHHHGHITPHPLAPAPAPAPAAHRTTPAAPWPLHAGAGPNDGPQGEATNEAAALHLEQAEEVILVGEEEEEEEEPVFVLTDEWAEFFAKSDAKRRLGNNHSSSHLISSSPSFFLWIASVREKKKISELLSFLSLKLLSAVASPHRHMYYYASEYIWSSLSFGAAKQQQKKNKGRKK